jgi:uncharacterized protein (DUF983 family)
VTAKETTAPAGFWKSLWGILRLRCPRCRRGKVFRGVFAMNDPCPTCGLLFQREEGYFLGAMYVSYALGAAVLLPMFFAAKALLPDLDPVLLTFGVMFAYWPLVPAVFRYSRVVWIYLDRLVAPGESSAGGYEKMRLKQLADQAKAPGESDAGPLR